VCRLRKRFFLRFPRGDDAVGLDRRSTALTRAPTRARDERATDDRRRRENATRASFTRARADGRRARATRARIHVADSEPSE
jgi:hypothetical protein